MKDEKPRGIPLTGPCFCGTCDQRQSIERWEDAGWTFLHWTEIPRMIAVLEGPLGEINLIDENGWAWRGPGINKTRLVPLEQWPPVNPHGVSPHGLGP